ncbi:PRE_C2HC domain-containing protein [Trichonephila clavipes]|uniref:PRE_C2HC domain-containing protein n=1 Tax=Trichonephila clavipes TaxID=2585209 RepID=A0A8X7BMK9_TRICX|nr:PRE_C2HC domain-containing protein [Trichonephila clavipes]
METKTSLLTKRKERSDGFTTPPHSTINDIDNQLNFQIELANKFSVLSQETAETLTTELASPTNQNIVIAPLPTENLLNASTPNSNAPKPNYVPPPIMLKVTETHKQQIKVITDKLPTTRGKLTGEFLKFYTNTNELPSVIIHLLEDLKYEFYVITPQEKRPIKIVIKGLSRDTKTDETENELTELCLTVNKVSQLIARITNQALPFYLVSLPRNVHNAKLFDLNKLFFLTVRVERYESKGVTQCFSCNKFNHTAENCHLKPRCSKCGEAHQTRECAIKRVEEMFCINCNMVGHMADYAKCSLYPKPKKVIVLLDLMFLKQMQPEIKALPILIPKIINK